MTVYEAARAWLKRLRGMDAAVAAQLIEAYLPIEARIAHELQLLQKQVAQAIADGENPVTWIRRTERLEILRRQVVDEIERYMGYAAQTIIGAQRNVLGESVEAAEAIVRAGQAQTPNRAVALAQWDRVPVQSFESLVGFLSDGSPMREWLLEKAPETWEEVQARLLHGLAVGQNPRVVGRAITEALDGNRVRAQATARQTMMNNSRTATLDNFRANRRVLNGWYWFAACDMRTCPVCWAKHGTFHGLNEGLYSHINCRCTAVPGVIDVPVTWETGAARFANLDPDEQEQIIGPGALALYREGRITLEDFPARTHSPRWGPGLRKRTVGELERLAELREAA